MAPSKTSPTPAQTSSEPSDEAFVESAFVESGTGGKPNQEGATNSPPPRQEPAPSPNFRPLQNGTGGLRRTPVRARTRSQSQALSRPKTPGAFPDSFVDDTDAEPVKVWVESQDADHLGARLDISKNHPHYYSRAQYENDASLLDHYCRHRKDLYPKHEFLTIIAKVDWYTASGVTSTFSLDKCNKIRAANRPYTLVGDRFRDITTPQDDFFAWLNRFRAGPTCGPGRASVSPSVADDQEQEAVHNRQANMPPHTRANGVNGRQPGHRGDAPVEEVPNPDPFGAPTGSGQLHPDKLVATSWF
jgi:hypothetical protein